MSIALQGEQETTAQLRERITELEHGLAHYKAQGNAYAERAMTVAEQLRARITELEAELMQLKTNTTTGDPND